MMTFVDFIDYSLDERGDRVFTYVRMVVDFTYENFCRYKPLARSQDLVSLFMELDIKGVKYDRPFEIQPFDERHLSADELQLIKDFCKNKGIEVIYGKN